MRGARGREGATLVEFAFVLVLFLTFLFGIMDFSRFLYTYHHLSNAAREGARWASVRGSTWTATCSSPWATSFDCKAAAGDVQNYVYSITPPGINTSSLTVNTTWLTTSPFGNTCIAKSPGCPVQVQLTYAFKFMFAFLPVSTFNINSTSTMVIAQ